MKGGLLKTEEKTRATRRMAPAWASQPVPILKGGRESVS